jgi:ketosteroid isomerase-like protein
MSTTVEVVQQAYGLAKRGDHRRLRELIADDATWFPAREGAWNPCLDADTIVRTLLWRSGPANRFKPGTTVDLGQRVLVQLRGTRMRRLGARGYRGKLAQIIDVRNGKIVRIQDYPGIEEAMAAAGQYS